MDEAYLRYLQSGLRVSQVIDLLQAQLKRRGDLPVIFNFNGHPCTVVQVLNRHENERAPQIEITGDMYP